MTAFTAQDIGICLNAEDLLLRVKTLAEVNGYTVLNYSDNIISTINRGKRLHLSKNGKFYNFAGVSLKAPVADGSADTKYSTNNLQSISCSVSTAFDVSKDWHRNTGSSSAGGLSQDTSTIRSIQVADNSNYWIYINDKSIIIITKFNPTNYSIMFLGELFNYSLTDSTHFVTASSETYSNYYATESILRNRRPFASQNTINTTSMILNNINLDDSLIRLFENHYSETATSSYPKFTMNRALATGMIARSDNVFNGTSLLFPIEYYKKDTDGGTSNMQPIGEVNNVFIVNMKNHQPETSFNIGTNQYIIFPFNRKYSPQAYDNEGFGLGIAIKVGE